MIKEEQAGLRVVSHMLSLIKYDLNEINKKDLANRIDSAKYLLGLLMEETDLSQQFNNFLEANELINNFNIYIDEKVR